jgi:hypothetical protein
MLLVGYPAGARVKLDSDRGRECGINTPAGVNAASHDWIHGHKGRITPVAPPDRIGSNDLAGGIIADRSESWLGQNSEFPIATGSR